MMKKSLDPVTYEVVKNKIRSVVKDQASTMRTVSGSPIVTDAFDFNNGIYLPNGLALTIGLHVLSHADSISTMIKSIQEECAEDPGINDGDQFFSNDPWRGALHQNDVILVTPIFYKGNLVAWAGVTAHQIDMGGMQFNSWCYNAVDVFQEAVPIPPVKLIEKGKLRTDIWKMILAHTRLPFLVGLDLRAMIASNNVAKARFLEMVERYGIDIARDVMGQMIEETSQGLRRRLREFPDGTYRGVVFWEHDGHEDRLYRTMVSAIKQGDTLTFDFTGTSPQAPGFINSTEPATKGAAAADMLMSFCFNLPWNGGIFEPLKFVIPKGTLTAAQFPAPVSGAPCASLFNVMAAVHIALARMLSCSEKYKSEASTVYCHSSNLVNVRGLNQYGEPFGTMIIDVGPGGGETFPNKDGFDGQGSNVPAFMLPDVETTENFAPVLYLHRRIAMDSGGGGEARGGASAGTCITLHDTNALDVVLVGHGTATPQTGLYGGGPGSSSRHSLARSTDILERFQRGELPTCLDELEGERTDLGAKPGLFPLLQGDALEVRKSASGGYGDPLERNPSVVLQDVINGRWSVEWAKRIYGVIVDPRTLQLDTKQTKQERQRMLRERLSLAKDVPRVHQIEATEARRIMPMGPYLEVVEVDKERIVRCRCGYQFGSIKQNWKDSAAMCVLSPDEIGSKVKLRGDLQLRAYFCPNCGLRHEVEITREGDPALWDIELGS